MKKIKSKLLFIGTFVLVISTLAFALHKTPVEASRYIIKDGDLLLVNDSLNAGKQITNSKDVQTLFDDNNSNALIGKGIKGNSPNTENRGGVELHLIKGNGIDSKVSDDLVTEAFFSHDGAKAYFVTNEKTLYSIVLETGKIEKIKDKVFEVVLSHDDSRIAYHKLNNDWVLGDYYEKALGIAVLDLKTNKETQVTTGWDDFFPIWTADDSKIIFYAANSGGLVSQFIVSADGSDRKQTSNIGQIYYSDKTTDHATGKPQWSPDGKTLVYESDNKIWINDFSSGYDDPKSEKIAFGKAPKWLDNNVISVIVTEAPNTINALIKVDKKGNIVK